MCKQPFCFFFLLLFFSFIVFYSILLLFFPLCCVSLFSQFFCAFAFAVYKIHRWSGPHERRETSWEKKEKKRTSGAKIKRKQTVEQRREREGARVVHTTHNTGKCLSYCILFSFFLRPLHETSQSVFVSATAQCTHTHPYQSQEGFTRRSMDCTFHMKK